MLKEYKKYSDVPEKYKFDLEFLLEGKTKEERIKEIYELYEKIIEIKNSKYDSKENYLKSLKLSEKLEIKTNKLFNYISNSLSTNVINDEIISFENEVEYKLYELSNKLGPESPRFFKNVTNIKKWIEDKKFDVYRKSILASIEDKKHQLPKAIQDFRQKESRADVATENIFSILTNSELDFGTVTTIKGKKIKVTDSNRIVLSKHKDKNIRKTAYIAYRKGYLRHKNTLSNLLYEHFKKTTVWSKLEKFNTTIDSLLYSDRVSEKMLLSLYSSVQEGNIIFKKYDLFWKKFYKIKYNEKPTKYDMNRDLVNVTNKYTPEEAIEITKKALKPFGQEYSDIYMDLISNKWIDFMPVKNKRSGAYSIGNTYGINKKLISMNFDGTLNSVSTLAHEVGHSIHSYYSDKKQHQNNSQYPIFLAEIASIFNELMLYDYMLQNSKDDKLKFYIYGKMISGFRATVNRQVEWSNFEYDMYKSIEKGKPVSSYEKISKIYYDNSQKYKNKKTKYNSKDSWMGIMVPHFYYNFYVYKYAIGQMCAMIFFEKYKSEGKEALQFYINKFLSSGARDWPVEILKDAGINLTNKETYELGFTRVEKYITEWVKLGKKLFKI